MTKAMLTDRIEARCASLAVAKSLQTLCRRRRIGQLEHHAQMQDTISEIVLRSVISRRKGFA